MSNNQKLKKDESMHLLQQMIRKGVSPSHVVEAAEDQLRKEGFVSLSMTQDWNLICGGKYSVNLYGNSLMAFTIGNDYQVKDSLRMAAAHTDFPCLRIKANPEMVTKGYGQLNVEVYGGPILNTWLDRPLSVAGKVVVKGVDAFHPNTKLVHINKALLSIPNLAVHMNKEVNSGVELNKQTQLLPILTQLKDEEKDTQFFMELIAVECQVKVEDILEFELSVYCREELIEIGRKEEFYSAPRLDNLTSVTALLYGLINGNRGKGINLIALFDHEEIGNRSKQGAASLLLRDVCERIFAQFTGDQAMLSQCLYESMLLSVDVAHGLHPNYVAKMDPTTQPVVNQGVCIKEACSQAYATDPWGVGVIMALAQEKNIPFQKFFNRSDAPGGGTLGATASTLIPVPTVDIGIPILAMHSAKEFMGASDMSALCDLMKEYFAY